MYCIWSCSAFEKMRKTPKTLSLASIGTAPYENRFVRSLIDACAFHIYGHWVKRGEEQNRAALFETTPKKIFPVSSSINQKLGFLRDKMELDTPPDIHVYTSPSS